MSPAVVVTFVYAALVFLGGLMGLKAGSQVSLIVSTVVAILLSVGGMGLKQKASWGFPLTAIMMVAMIGFGIYRFIETGKVMPPIGIAALSAVSLIALLATAKK